MNYKKGKKDAAFGKSQEAKPSPPACQGTCDAWKSLDSSVLYTSTVQLLGSLFLLLLFW